MQTADSPPPLPSPSTTAPDQCSPDGVEIMVVWDGVMVPVVEGMVPVVEVMVAVVEVMVAVNLCGRGSRVGALGFPSLR